MNDLILDAIDNHGDTSSLHEFYFYEPWDVKERPQWMIDMAMEDGVDLRGGELARVCGPDPHPFQTGYHMSCAPLRSLLAGSRVGKSWAALCEDVMCLTGEIPFSMRFPQGDDTGIPRRITKANILRWGRQQGGIILDYDWRAEQNGKWNCGNIIGAGVFPQEKLLNPGEEVWLGTTLKSYQSYWLRKLDPTDSQCIIPQHFFDTSRARTGYNKDDGVLYLSRNTILRVITYETGYNRFEAGQSTRRITLDEEPTDRRIFAAALIRCNWLSLVMSPYNGITYTKEHVLPSRPTKKTATFHACQYDSPYREKEEIDNKRTHLSDWERAARIWGLYSDQRGKPYYDRTKINLWLQRYDQPFTKAIFSPSRQYFGPVKRPDVSELPGLMDVNVLKLGVMDDEPGDSFWKIYEDVKPGEPYYLCLDTSEGDENPDDQKDVNACGIARPGADRPIIAATIRTKRPVVEFSEMVLLAARYYNNGMICAESAKRGATNATFYHETKAWPHWFKMAVTNDYSGRLKEIAGFDTNSKTRDMIFLLIREWLDAFKADEYPEIPDRDLLSELASCVTGKNGRADHSTGGTLDSAVWFGIMLYVWKYSRNQITFNGQLEVRQSKIRGIMQGREPVKPRTFSFPQAMERR